MLKANSILVKFLQQLDVMFFLEKKVGKSWAGAGRGSEFDFLVNFLKWGLLGLSPSASDQAERTVGLASWDVAVVYDPTLRWGPHSWHLMLCGCHLEILNNFTFEFVFCE